MSFTIEFPKKAQTCIEHLLYDISDKTLHNIAAALAQKTGSPIKTFATAKGQWSWPVIEHLLSERGMKFTKASNGKNWLIDSPHYLRHSEGFVGFINIDTLDSYKWRECIDKWTTQNGNIEKNDMYHELQNGNTVAIHKMWIPFKPFYSENKAFHITTDGSKWTRYECQPTSCWHPQKVCYKERDTTVKKYMKAHKKSPIMMSSSQEVVLCKPGKQGWETETLLNYEFLSIEETSQQIAEILADKLVAHIGEGEGWGVMAHALFCAFTKLGGKLNTKEHSKFTEEEIAILEKYENGMYKSTLNNLNGR